MDAAARSLIGLHDFAAYCKPREEGTTIRTLLEFDWRRDAEGVLVANVKADAFCHSMVRALVGACVAVGQGRLDRRAPRRDPRRGGAHERVHRARRARADPHRGRLPRRRAARRAGRADPSPTRPRVRLGVWSGRAHGARRLLAHRARRAAAVRLPAGRCGARRAMWCSCSVRRWRRASISPSSCATRAWPSGSSSRCRPRAARPRRTSPLCRGRGRHVRGRRPVDDARRGAADERAARVGGGAVGDRRDEHPARGAHALHLRQVLPRRGDGRLRRASRDSLSAWTSQYVYQSFAFVKALLEPCPDVAGGPDATSGTHPRSLPRSISDGVRKRRRRPQRTSEEGCRLALHGATLALLESCMSPSAAS